MTAGSAGAVALGKLIALSDLLVRGPDPRPRSASATPAGRPMARRPSATPIRIVAGRVAVVHNGIIENFRALRAELRGRGPGLRDRDRHRDRRPSRATARSATAATPLEAVRDTLARLEGAFALVFLFEGHPDLMIVARRGSPLAIGYGEGEMFVGSDALALGPLTHRIAYLEEGDHAVVDPRRREVFDADGAPVRREIQPTPVEALPRREGPLQALHGEGDPRAAGRDRRRARALPDAGRDAVAAARRRSTSPASTRLTLVACGTAHYACHVAKYWIESARAAAGRHRGRLRVPLPRAAARRPARSALFVSQSGETADTLAALRYCAPQGARIALGGQRARPRPSRARATSRCRSSRGRRSASPRPRPSPASSPCSPCLADRRRARRAAAIDAAEEARLAAALGALPGLLAQTAGARARSRRDRARRREGARRAVPRPRADVPARAGRRAEAEGDQLHPRRRLCGGRAEARPDRADRRGGAGDRARPLGRAVREDRLQHAGGDGARRPGHADHATPPASPAPATASPHALALPACDPFVAPDPLRRRRCSCSPITWRCSRAPTSTSRATSPSP